MEVVVENQTTEFLFILNHWLFSQWTLPDNFKKLEISMIPKLCYGWKFLVEKKLAILDHRWQTFL